MIGLPRAIIALSGYHLGDRDLMHTQLFRPVLNDPHLLALRPYVGCTRDG